MFPVIFSVGPFSLYSYGVFLVIALMLALFVVWKRGRELYFEEEELFDALFFVLLMMLVTARLGYVLVRFDVYGLDVLDWMNVIGRPGLLYEAGLIGGIAAAIYQAKKRKWDAFLLGDVLAPALTLALIMVSLGAFLNGSGYGVYTEGVLGMSFPGLYEKRYPVQLLEMVLYAGLFGLLWRLEKVYRTIGWYKGSRSEAKAGFITSVFLIGQGMIGMMAALLREGISLYGLRIDGLFYLGMFLLGGGLLLTRSELRFVNKTREGFANLTASNPKRKEIFGRSRGKRGRKKDLDQGIF